MKGIKRIILGALALICAIGLSAQNYIKNPAMIECGESNVQIVYLHQSTDPVLKQTEERKEILVAGDNVSTYLNYGQFLWNNAVDSIGRNQVPFNVAMNLTQRYNVQDASYFIVKNWKDKTLLFNHYVSMGCMQYQEPLPQFKWEEMEGEEAVCGYLCKIAKCDFRGRTWIACYTNDIANTDGPWKFNGLNGAILKVVSQDTEHSFEALEIIFDKQKNQYEDRSKTSIKTTREKYAKALYRHKTNPSQSMAGIVTNVDGSPIVMDRKFYNPEEKK